MTGLSFIFSQSSGTEKISHANSGIPHKIKFGDSNMRKRSPEISTNNTPNHMLLKKLANPKFQAR